MSIEHKHKNVIDFQFYKNLKESKNKKHIDNILKNKLPYNCLAYKDEQEVQTRMQNINLSVKRINSLIFELNNSQKKPHN
ncbi:hypothetical protein [Spirobacillus cienkowskii]|uniref:hypothetical protein n=1 Tax=Spirobacillus cienkowskii TaxID=495820 RepID=UPI0030D1A6E9